MVKEFLFLKSPLNFLEKINLKIFFLFSFLIISEFIELGLKNLLQTEKVFSELIRFFYPSRLKKKEEKNIESG